MKKPGREEEEIREPHPSIIYRDPNVAQKEKFEMKKPGRYSVTDRQFLLNTSLPTLG